MNHQEPISPLNQNTQNSLQNQLLSGMNNQKLLIEETQWILIYAITKGSELPFQKFEFVRDGWYSLSI